VCRFTREGNAVGPVAFPVKNTEKPFTSPPPRATAEDDETTNPKWPAQHSRPFVHRRLSRSDTLCANRRHVRDSYMCNSLRNFEKERNYNLKKKKKKSISGNCVIYLTTMRIIIIIKTFIQTSNANLCWHFFYILFLFFVFCFSVVRVFFKNWQPPITDPPSPPSTPFSLGFLGCFPGTIAYSEESRQQQQQTSYSPDVCVCVLYISRLCKLSAALADSRNSASMSSFLSSPTSFWLDSLSYSLCSCAALPLSCLSDGYEVSRLSRSPPLLFHSSLV
jgi:hypothetical protein